MTYRHHSRAWRRLGVLALALFAFTPAMATLPTASAQMADVMTTATTTGFTAPTPTGWSVEDAAPVLRMTRTEPEGEIVVTAVRTSDVDAAVLPALRAWVDPAIDATFAGSPAQTSPANLPTGTWTQRIYLRGDQIVALLTHEREDATYLLMARGTQAAFTQDINAAVGQVLLGLDIQADAQTPAEESAAIDDAFAAEDVSVEIPAGTLYGTLLVPTDVPDPPVVLIIAGSGPTDRNGNSPLIAGRNDSLKLLAEGLARRGIASLRYDKRGIAQSAGALTDESEILFEDFVDDAVAWLDALAADDRFAGTFVAGHSEGSLIGMLAAERASAQGFVSIAGPGRSAADLLRTQLADQLPAPLLEEATDVLAALEAGETVAEVSPDLASLFRASVQPYLISWFRYEPTEAIARLDMPVQIVQGTTDIQVAVAEAELLAAAVPDAELVLIEDMNHVLKEVPTGEDPLASYRDPTLPLADGLLDAIATFILDVTQSP